LKAAYPQLTDQSINGRFDCNAAPILKGCHMQVPLRVTFQDIEHSDAVETRIREEAEKLEQFYDRITSLQVVIARPQHRHRKGDTYRVKLHMTIPGAADIAINRDPDATGAHEDVYVTIRDAFKAARRQLQDFARMRQGNVKEHETPPHGTISLLRPEADHGFIAAADGREIYFHRNSVAGGKLEDLKPGQQVRFSEAIGEKGPQATYVQLIGKPRLD
jgi:cold shock CspA family protein/ribosome-associated translation inhibitor RaiA